MESLKLKIKINNSYESEPSTGSGSSLSEHHDYVVSDDENNMHLPYLLTAPSYQSEVIITTSNDYEPKQLSQPTLAATIIEGVEQEHSRQCYAKFMTKEPTFKGYSGLSPFRQALKPTMAATTAAPPQPTYFDYDCTTATTIATTDLVTAAATQPPQHYQQPATNKTAAIANEALKTERELCYGVPTHSSEESSFEGFSDSPFGKIQRAIYANKNYNQKTSPDSTAAITIATEASPGKMRFTNFFDIITVEENSCNAVDMIMSIESNIAGGTNSAHASQDAAASVHTTPSSELSFNGKIKGLTNNNNVFAQVPTPTPIAVAPQLPTVMETSFNAVQLLTESFILKKYTNERSPDLFGDDDDDDDDDEENANEQEAIENDLTEQIIELDANTQQTEPPQIYEHFTILTDVTQDAPPAQTAQQQQLKQEQNDEQHQEDISINKSYNCPTESSFCDDKTIDGSMMFDQRSTASSFANDPQSLLRANCRRERELQRRIRKCLAGVPPPPTLTIPQIDVVSTVLQMKQQIFDFHQAIVDTAATTTTASCGGAQQMAMQCGGGAVTSLFKPTHSMEETQSMAWKDILGVRQHGLSYNLNKASENNEYLSLSVVERFIGAETASSYRLSPSSAKKRNARLKLLTASPGNRLSHLAKRRAVFSSANLATTSLKSTTLLGTQILLDKKKNKTKRKATPKRKTPGSKKKNVRKTPSSSARKRLYRCDLMKPGPSRETSKRALFQSPAKTLQQQKYALPKPPIKPEIATRVEKSKRALFSPDKLSQNSVHSTFAYYSGSDSNTQQSSNSCTATSFAGSSKLESLLLKRKRHPADDDDDESVDAASSKIFRGSSQGLTPRALKIKSQSFCIGAGSSANMNNSRMMSSSSSSSNLTASRNLSFGGNNLPAPGAKLVRAFSETTASMASLTENQRKKLLWAVSQALQEKKITGKHESFKQYASVLARVVRRIFQEFYLRSTTSNSETMLRLAKKYVYHVINGKNVDDIYFQARAQIDDSKRQSSSRLTGYVAPEEYEQRKNIASQAAANHLSQTQSSLSMSLSHSQLNLFGIDSSMDSFGMSMSQASAASSLSQSTLTSGQLLERIAAQEPLMSLHGIQPNAALQNSSSKNNLCGLALRENVDCELLRRSAQKNFSGKDQRNLSPYNGAGVQTRSSAVKAQSTLVHDMTHAMVAAGTAAKAKRQISFDS